MTFKYIGTNTSRALGIAALSVLPLLAFAQDITDTDTTGSSCTTGLCALFSLVLNILNDYVVPVVFALAFIVFLYGVYRYFIQGGGSAEKVGEGRQFLLWSVIGFVVMFSIWGIINLFAGTVPGLLGAAQPEIPTFTNTSAGDDLDSLGSSLFGNTDTSSTGLPGSGSVESCGLFGCPSGCTAVPGSSSCVANGTTGTVNGVPYTASPTGTLTSGTPTTGTYGTGPSCTNNTQCPGDEVCNDATQTCAVDSATAYSCADDSTANAQGLCANGQPPTNINGDQAPSDGSVGANQSCAGNEDACGTGLICGTSGTCQAIPQDGAVGTGGSCLGNENACIDGDTCDDDSDTCQPDANVNNGDTTVSCNDGTTQDIDTGCSDDCGAVGSTNTCNTQPAASQTCSDGTTAASCVSCSSCGWSGTSDSASDCQYDCDIYASSDDNSGSPSGGDNNIACDDGSSGPCVSCESGNTVGSASECAEDGGSW